MTKSARAGSRCAYISMVLGSTGMQAQLKAAKEQQKAERQAQLDAARLLSEQAKAARAEAKAARDAEKAAAVQLAAAAKEAKERERSDESDGEDGEDGDTLADCVADMERSVSPGRGCCEAASFGVKEGVGCGGGN